MGISDIIENDLTQSASSIWTLRRRKPFHYSDGSASERYLKRVLSTASDVTSSSLELEMQIKDWPSEYHLSTKRAQLLRGFRFEPSLRVLEVGCGCGAITRFLAEQFREVVAIEGSATRAELARLRTRDCRNVSIVCAPFQDIQFRTEFDLIFSIGVFEYSASFIQAADPFAAVLKYFHDVLSKSGAVVMAIENQFGLKYFSSAREDHVSIPFEGLEGYPRYGHKVRTFGREELRRRVEQFFPVTRWFYPYPDYKLPDCVLSEEFLLSGLAGEMVAQLIARYRTGGEQRRWNESLTVRELEKNGALPFFANSFLLVAQKSRQVGIGFDHLGVLYESRRVPELRTVTEIRRSGSDDAIAYKRPSSGKTSVRRSSLTLEATESKWISSCSLQTDLLTRCRRQDVGVEEVFSACQPWLTAIVDLATWENGVAWLDGACVDNIWCNAYVRDGQCVFIDREWVWHDKIRLTVLVVRSIFVFLERIQEIQGLPRTLSDPFTSRLIKRIARGFGIEVSSEDMREFVSLESQFQSVIYGKSEVGCRAFLSVYLWNRSILFAFRRVRYMRQRCAALAWSTLRYFASKRGWGATKK